MNVQQILEAIAALPDAERRDLLSRLRELYPVVRSANAGRDGEAAPAARQMGLALGGWDGPSDYVIVFDGGSQGNPGPAYGSYAISQGPGKANLTRLTFDSPMTNNEAEYHTLLAALRDLLKQLGERAGQVTLEVRGDSQLVIQQVSGAWKAKDERMRGLRDEVRRLLNRFKSRRLMTQPREETVRVLGH